MTAPVEFRLPVVDGNPDAVLRLARALDDLATCIARERRQVAAVLEQLPGGWSGPGARSVEHPADRFGVDSGRTTAGLRQSAGELSKYAAALQHAHEHHGWSLSRLAALGAIITVTTAAVVVTMGAGAAAAGTVDAEAAAGAADEVTAAADMAEAAAGGAATGLDDAAGTLSGVRAMSAYLAPHLVAAELNAGGTALVHETFDGRIHWSQVVGAGLAGSGASAMTEAFSTDLGAMLSGRSAWVQRLGPHLLQAGAWGAADGAGDFLDSGRVDLRDVAGGFAAGGVGSAGGEVWRAVRQAAKRDAARALLDEAHWAAGRLLGDRPLDLDDDRTLRGHAVERHVDLTVAQAIERLAMRERSSLFLARPVAAQAVGQVLRENRWRVQRWLAGGHGELELVGQYREGFSGVVYGRLLPPTYTRRLVVVLDRRDGLPYIKTAYPKLTPILPTPPPTPPVRP